VFFHDPRGGERYRHAPRHVGDFFTTTQSSFQLNLTNELIIIVIIIRRQAEDDCKHLVLPEGHPGLVARRAPTAFAGVSRRRPVRLRRRPGQRGLRVVFARASLSIGAYVKCGTGVRMPV